MKLKLLPIWRLKFRAKMWRNGQGTCSVVPRSQSTPTFHEFRCFRDAAGQTLLRQRDSISLHSTAKIFSKQFSMDRQFVLEKERFVNCLQWSGCQWVECNDLPKRKAYPSKGSFVIGKGFKLHLAQTPTKTFQDASCHGRGIGSSMGGRFSESANTVEV